MIDGINYGILTVCAFKKNSFKLARALATKITNVNQILFKNELHYNNDCIYPVRWHLTHGVLHSIGVLLVLFTIRTI